jgi:hypothetical protein
LGIFVLGIFVNHDYLGVAANLVIDTRESLLLVLGYQEGMDVSACQFLVKSQLAELGTRKRSKGLASVQAVAEDQKNGTSISIKLIIDVLSWTIV